MNMIDKLQQTIMKKDQAIARLNSASVSLRRTTVPRMAYRFKPRVQKSGTGSDNGGPEDMRNSFTTKFYGTTTDS